MPIHRDLATLILALSASFGLIACADTESAPLSSTAEAGEGQVSSPPEVLATIGDHRITLAQVDAKALQLDANQFGNQRLAQALYEARRQVLDELIGEYVIDREATKRGLTADKFVQAETATTIKPVEDAELQAWYKDNSGRVGNAPFEQVKNPIRAFLQQERRQTAVLGLVERLRAQHSITISLDPPRMTIEVAEDDPTLGPAGAPVQIVEYSDFQCPFCARVTPTLTRVRQIYGDKVRLAFKDLPLDNHAQAFKAAEAGHCAHEQGKFWPYHDVLFAKQREGLGVDQLKKYASELGLEASAFETCLDQGKFADLVRQDLKSAQGLGVTATPTFFINGRPLSGAQPFEAFKRMIDEELARR